MDSDQSSYRKIIKATSIFGGVQLFTILIAIIRSKFVAVLLGPTGMGIAGLLTSTTGLIASITNFGLGTSAIKDIAEAHSTGNITRIATVVVVFRKLVWITGLLGAIIVFFLAPKLSELTFGNRNYSVAFAWVSVTLLLNQISEGQFVLLRGMQRIKLLAKASLLGSFVGLFVSIPIYFKWGLDGIVPAIITSSITSLFISFYFSRKIKIENVVLKPPTILREGKGMLVMGFFIGLTGLMDQGVALVTKLYISNFGNVEVLGLYDAGFVIVNTYVSLVFTAMMTYYYPRLSVVANDVIKSNKEINQQAEIAILILAPMVIFFLVFINFIIVILYSDRFLPMESMLHWAMLGVFFKVVNWSIGILTLAKGDTKLYTLLYPVAVIIVLTTNFGGYYFFGLKGLGIAFLSTHFLLSIQSYFISKHLYSFAFQGSFIKVFCIQFSLALVCFIFVESLKNPFNYIVGLILFLLSIFYSFHELDRRINIKQLLKNIKLFK